MLRAGDRGRRDDGEPVMPLPGATVEMFGAACWPHHPLSSPDRSQPRSLGEVAGVVIMGGRRHWQHELGAHPGPDSPPLGVPELMPIWHSTSNPIDLVTPDRTGADTSLSTAKQRPQVLQTPNRTSDRHRRRPAGCIWRIEPRKSSIGPTYLGRNGDKCPRRRFSPNSASSKTHSSLRMPSKSRS